jgi:hypothetical protein
MIACFSKLVFAHGKKIVESKLFNEVMNYITQQFHRNGKLPDVKKSLKDFYLTLRGYFKDDEKFEKFLNIHYSVDSLKRIINITYGEF